MVYKELKNKEADFTNHSYWEEVLDEDLWEDGELKLGEVFDKINYHLFVKGNWRLIRRKDD
jgi:hypothetical protein